MMCYKPAVIRIAFLFASLLLSSVCSNAEPTLRWAADPNSNAPYAFYTSGKTLVGFEYEIINAVARRMGRQAQFVPNDWSGLIPGLDRDLYDCVICGIEVTPAKREQVIFSIPPKPKTTGRVCSQYQLANGTPLKLWGSLRANPSAL